MRTQKPATLAYLKINKMLRSISSYIRRLNSQFLCQDRARLDGQQSALSD